MTKGDTINVIRGEVDGSPLACISIGCKGCVEIRLLHDTADLRRLLVAPEHRRKGVGSFLFKIAVNISKEEGKIAISWTVRKDNAAAIAFYRRQGATIFHDDGIDYWMGRPL